jgi:hypothetical protein
VGVDRRESLMSEERRNQDRRPDFHALKLVTVGGAGKEKSYPVTLRDTSGAGLGAMYVGKEVLNPKDDFLLKGGADGDRKVRIMWTKQVADFVLMLGMEYADA